MRAMKLLSIGVVSALAAAGAAVLVLDDGDPGQEVEAAAAAEVAPEEPRVETVEDWCAPSEPRPDEPTPEQIREHEEALAEQLAFELETGWGRVTNLHYATGETVCGYTPAMGTSYEDMAATIALTQAQPHGLPVTPVYDSIEGELIGNIYGAKAFVPIEVASQPDVDIAALVD